jgi:myxalamid-type nonribosomal peptide synthetase MxaA
MTVEPAHEANQTGNASPSANRANEEALMALLMAEAGFEDLPPHAILSHSDKTEASLSFAQQRLWFLDQLEPDSTAYNMPTAIIRMVGPLDVKALTDALAAIISRHDILRTTFRLVSGQPQQQILDADPSWKLLLFDLQQLPPEARQAEINRRVTGQATQPFNLSTGPLLRLALLNVGEREHLLLVTFHHIVSDGWSLEVFCRELSALYTAFEKGSHSPLPPLPIQYSDYAEWQHRNLDIYRPQLEYWRNQLANIPPVLHLPTDRPRTKHTSSRPSYRHRFALSADLSAQLRALAQEHQATLFMVLLSAFKILLYRYTRQTDICVGTNIANRTQTEVEGLIGFFANTLVMRADLSGNQTFLDLLQQVRRVALEAYENQEIPFGKVVEELQPERDLTLTPFFQVMFVLQTRPVSLKLPGISTTFTEVDSGTAKFDLELEIIDEPVGLSGSIEFDTTLFEQETVARMVGNFQTLLTAIVAEPESMVTALPLLPSAEKDRLLVTWNQTERAFKLDECFHQIFEKQVDQTPDAVAVSCDETLLTYRQLNSQANQLAHLLVEQGVGPEIVVALLAERSIEFLIMILAVLKAGGAYLPLDPRHPPHRHHQILAQSRFPLTLTSVEYKSSLDDALAGVPATERPVILAVSKTLTQNRPGTNLQVRSTSQNLAYVIFTSGSTGRPKGAMVEQQGMLNHLWSKAEDLQLTSEDIIAQNAAQTFDISVWQFLAALLVGGQVRIFRDEVAFDPQRLFTAVAQYKITIFQVVPSLLKAIVQSMDSPNLPRPDLSRLRWVVPTGEALTTELARQWLTRYPGIPMMNAYGSTECSDDQCHHPVFEIQPGYLLPTIPIGKAMANVQMYILDHLMAPVPVGVPGELYVGGIGVGRGYLHDPARTAATFLPDPFSELPGQRLYKTGDLGRYLPDGAIEFLGRVDFMVKIRGFRIELGEIEATLTYHPGIQEAVVLARSPQSGSELSGEKCLVAYVVPTPKAALTAPALRGYIKEKLPAYMVPSAFVFMETMPLTRNGKIDRNAFPEPDMQGQLPGSHPLPPNGPVEEALAEIWAELLKLPQIGASDNFFEIGGHSLLATQLIYQIRDVFKVDMPVRELFASPTISELARAIEISQLGEGVAQTNAIDFEAEAELPQEFQPVGPPVAQGGDEEPVRLFLTGGTGFLGTFLLAELLTQTDATIYCLVRAADATAGGHRLIGALKRYGLWQSGWESRIMPVVGDLTKPKLGLTDVDFLALAQTVAAIYHNGALVNFVYPYDALKAANVDGTKEVLRLAMQHRPISLHYVSTVSVFDSRPYFKVGRVITEREKPGHPTGLMYGYAQTKWVAEQLVQQAGQRGLPVTIYRPGTVTGDSRTGYWNSGDYLGRFITGCIQLGLAPDLDQTLWLSPVDFVAQSIVYLARTGRKPGPYHVISHNATHLRQLFGMLANLGYDLPIVPYNDWQAALLSTREENTLYPILPLFTERVLPEEPKSLIEFLELEPEYDTVQFQAALTKSGITCPPLDRAIWQRYLDDLLRE